MWIALRSAGDLSHVRRKAGVVWETAPYMLQTGRTLLVCGVWCFLGQGNVVCGRIEGADPPELSKRVQKLADDNATEKDETGLPAPHQGLTPELRVKLSKLVRYSFAHEPRLARGGSRPPSRGEKSLRFRCTAHPEPARRR